jgi:hypothetical protein
LQEVSQQKFRVVAEILDKDNTTMQVRAAQEAGA